MFEPDSVCDCDHVHEKHEANGCAVDGCDCGTFELNFFDMLDETRAQPTFSFPQNDGRLIRIVPLMFGRFQLQIGPGDAPVYDDAW